MKIDVDFKLKLKGKTAVFIDWANVYGWKKSLKKEVSPQKLYNYLKNYKEIKQIYLYYGEDKHPKSKEFLITVKKVGFNVISKEVKYIPVSLDSSHFKNIAGEIITSLASINNLKAQDIEKILQILSRKVLRRKCDFDMEISIDTHKSVMENVESFLFFSGDGDFAPLYKFLINLHKQVIVIYASGHLGKEVWNLKKGIFKTEIDNLPVV